MSAISVSQTRSLHSYIISLISYSRLLCLVQNCYHHTLLCIGHCANSRPLHSHTLQHLKTVHYTSIECYSSLSVIPLFIFNSSSSHNSLTIAIQQSFSYSSSSCFNSGSSSWLGTTPIVITQARSITISY